MPKKLKEVENEKPKTVKKASEPVLTTANIAERVKNKAEQMKDILDRQSKVSILIPLERGEKRGTVQPFCINGYRFTIPKGVMTQVPEQVAQMVSERFNVELDVRSQSIEYKSKETREALS